MELDFDQVAILHSALDDHKKYIIYEDYNRINKSKAKTEEPLVKIQWYFKKYPKYDDYVLHILKETPQKPIDNCCPDCYEPVDYTMQNCKACGQHLDWSTTK